LGSSLNISCQLTVREAMEACFLGVVDDTVSTDDNVDLKVDVHRHLSWLSSIQTLSIGSSGHHVVGVSLSSVKVVCVSGHVELLA